MTVANQTNRIAAVGNAAIGQEVPFSFPYAATSDITVYSRVTATGVETLLAETTNYTLTAASDTGGTLTTVTAVAATSEIHIIRNTPKTQSLDLEQGGSFNAENIEDALDKNTKLVIENKDSLDRALRAPATDAVALDLELPNSVDRASKNLGFDAGGNVTVTDSSGTFLTTNAYWDDVIVKSPWFDIRAFLPSGFVVDGSVDYATELQAAIDEAESVGRTLYFPNGTFLTNSSLNITDEIKMIRGEGYNSVIKAGAAITAIFDFTSGGTDATTNIFITIKDLFLQGNNNANYCIYATKMARTNFCRVITHGAKLANVELAGDQFINNFYGCKFLFSYQDGFHSSTTATNATNFHGCTFEGNLRLGAYIQSVGASINFDGCTIENNGRTGIWAFAARNLNIHKCYFEANVEEGGVVVTNPTAFTIKADVVLGGTNYPDVSTDFPLKNISIKNNYHHGLGMDCMYYGSGIDSGEISDNYNLTTSKVCLGIYGNRSYSRIRRLKMSNNRDDDGLYADSIEILDAEPAADSYKQQLNSHEIQVADVPHKNYMPQDFTAYTKVVDNGKSSEIYRSNDTFRSLDSFIIKKAADSSDTWGATFDIDNNHPELLGKLCYFGAWVKWTQTGGNDNNVILYTTTTGEHANYAVAAPSDWTFISTLFTMPAAGATTWKMGFRKFAAGTTNTIDVASPVLARVGDGYLSHIPEQNAPASTDIQISYENAPVFYENNLVTYV